MARPELNPHLKNLLSPVISDVIHAAILQPHPNHAGVLFVSAEQAVAGQTVSRESHVLSSRDRAELWKGEAACFVRTFQVRSPKFFLLLSFLGRSPCYQSKDSDVHVIDQLS